MIRFRRSDTDVIAEVDLYIPGIGEQFYPAKFNLATEVEAAFVCQAIKEHMNDSLESIRNESYSAGWRDAKAKRRRKTWFSRQWV